jgi:hypothetical protein
MSVRAFVIDHLILGLTDHTMQRQSLIDREWIGWDL